MHATWTLADSGGGLIPFIVIVVVIVINVIKLATRRSKEQAEERRRAAAQPKSAPDTRTAASAPEKGTAAKEVDRFLEDLARQSGVPLPPRQPAPQQPKPAVTTAPHAPVPAARPHAPVAVHHAPATRPLSVETVTMAEAMALPSELEPVAGLPAMAHLSPLAQAVILREIVGPCRAFRPHRARPRGW